ncbi:MULTISPECIES: type III secretion system ATPase SctN [Mesorhizobium]|uniref:Type 3 secretion system ATPase n=6 Tax=Mesorhizobium TaxID=68287 RepID=A0ABU5A877_9HYPH|nr:MULTISPECIES: type III secretion system ATPase SctN [Mesorhizobium]MDX8437832.1 type III secretion system ATPase SctN [Mesorhizobium abyssinicae]MDX8443979.1 type III secretion system ATPase SctN [Mesorhizobium sp. VK3C]MDX8456406.1 type III secretion system ATPase SctN [Mesorhizobium sp. VK9D]MDX8461282.1 type III secretion system ATPase SctN [Mesorhizobium sp. VK2D]MDX8481588.1 type III secretion system ATPase SctN [Mesorhizobium sp. VK24D]
MTELLPQRGSPAVDRTMDAALSSLRSTAKHIDTRVVRGRLTRAVGTVLHAVLPDARIGELCLLQDPRTGRSLEAEVIGFLQNGVLLTPIGDMVGLSSRAEVVASGRMHEVPVGPDLLGRVIDSFGRPLDGKGALKAGQTRPLRGKAPNPMTRRMIERPFPLGIRALDGLLTCGEGQRIGIYGEPGCGKSTLLSQIIKGAAADVNIVALIGERGREVREFVERHLGEAALRRTIVVVETSDRSAMERAQCAHMASALAEHFREQGQRVVLMMDSLTRFCRAMREIGLAAGEPPTRRGFPPSVFAMLPGLLERAGMGERGSITAFYTVLVEGDGVGDPIAEESRGILDGHVVLSRTIAARSHFPAIDVLQSRSRVMDAVVSMAHRKAASTFRDLLSRYAESEFLVKVGEYKQGNDPLTDRAIDSIGDLQEFLRQGEDEASDFEETFAWMLQLTA